MSFINWGSESPEQLAARKKMEDTMMFEQAAFNAATAAAAAAGSGGIKSNKISFRKYAPSGQGGFVDAEVWSFDYWETSNFPAVKNVSRLVLKPGSHDTETDPYAHSHSDDGHEDLTISLYDADGDRWVTVWTQRIYDVEDYFFDLDISFPSIASVTAIRLGSYPGSDWTYHNWDSTTKPAIFELYSDGAAVDDTLVLRWNPTGPQDSEIPLPVSFEATNFTGSDLSNGYNQNTNTGCWPVEAAQDTEINLTQYLEFGISAPLNTQFKTVTYTKESYNYVSCPIATIRSSADSYTENIEQVIVDPLRGIQTLVFDVSSLAPTNEINFRIYFWGATGYDYVDLTSTERGGTGLSVYTA
ncbi:hypothetical protein UFOVP1247_37 [uncultured Caudovirales phage]|uniref:Uncharacterized protein n=1 Tax=uncultured Caudovirales phage TaxID=2100421 RepID=A0A6J5PST9_9CAUD|nr:hypothetical protein UFOVP970_77 [uncultured Caudovirales phage]CAB4193205.1 hypothetical protein UFOVP1247_37 [uncultured Caudovirales phage]